MVVSSGQGINIWKSPWIPSIELFKPSPNPNLGDLPDFEVANLLNEGSRSWNVALLTDLFDSNSTQHIKTFTYLKKFLVIGGLVQLLRRGNFLSDQLMS